MNKLFIAAIMLCAVFSAYPQSRETRNLSSFDELSVGSAVEVILKKGTEEKAEVVVEGTEARNVITEVSGSHLSIHMRSGNYHHVDATVYLTYNELESIEISSAARVECRDVIESGSMDISVSSAGKGDINLKVDVLEVDISSAGNLTLRGYAGSQDIEVSSAGGYNGEDLQCEEAEIKVSSAGNARVNVNKSLDAQANSGGSIRYRGNPGKEYTSENSGGNVRKVD